MRKIPSILFCLCALLALTACGRQPSGTCEDVPVSPQEAPASSPVEEPIKPVEFGTGAASAGVELPADWEYELPENTDGLLSGIRIWPTASSESAAINEPLSAEGAQAAPPAAAVIGFYEYPFGVCGTGLKEERVLLPDGAEVNVGYYDGSPDWSFVSFRDLNETLAAVNNGLTGAEAQQALTVILSLTDTCA